MEPLEIEFNQFNSILPHSATPNDIEHGKQLLGELPEENLFAQVSVLLKLGSFYLENKTFDQNYSLTEAKNCYSKANEIGRKSNNIQWVFYSAAGLANTLARQYNLFRNSEDFINAEMFYCDSIEWCEKSGMTEEANSNRMNYSQLLLSASHGDRFISIEKAIALLRKILDTISHEVLGENFSPEMYGRVLYNLAEALRMHTEEPGQKNVNFNEAVDKYYEALKYRPSDKDPVGRVRILRKLAHVLPNWSGADSIEHAYQLAQQATDEANQLEGVLKFPEKAGWAMAKQHVSAIYWELDSIPETRKDQIAASNFHQQFIDQIPKETQPFLWAEWLGGYARLIGRLGIVENNIELINNSQFSFLKAIEAVPQKKDQRLAMILNRELGCVCHEVGHWELSLEANKNATDIGLNLTDNAGTDISRTNELESFIKAIHFAVFAAAKLNREDEAVVLAEIGRARWMDEAIKISSIRLSSLPAEFKIKVDKLQAKILDLERQEHDLLDQGISGDTRRWQNELGIPLGGKFKMRITADPNGTESKRMNELSNVRSLLQQEHENLNLLLNSIEEGSHFSWHPNSNQIKEISKCVGFPLVYLLSSSWGSVVIIVYKKVDLIQIPELISKKIQHLLYKNNGYLSICTRNEGDLEASLQEIQTLLDKYLMPPLIKWCNSNNINSIGIVGLGDIGLLPLQVSTVPANLNVHVVPSARSLRISLSDNQYGDHTKIKLLSVGGMISEGLPPLEFSNAEALFFSESFRNRGAMVSEFSDVPTLAEIEREIEKSTHLHFCCHGSFASFSPLSSKLHLEGNEVLTVESLLRPRLRLLGVELVILSACNSATLEFWRTPDESIGFPATFIAAGAKTVVAAQWPVSDAATFVLMQLFCKELNFNGGLKAAQCLANAQRQFQNATTAMIKDVIVEFQSLLGNSEMRIQRLLNQLQTDIESLGSEYPFRERKYWAAFICVGA